MNTLLYQSIADELEQFILNGHFSDGEHLPSERVLATQYGVSRNVIREAIKILIEKKLVKNVIGKGNYVTLPTEKDLVDMVESALNTSNISIKEIVDSREDLEIAIGQHILNQNPLPDLGKLYQDYEQMDLVMDNPVEFVKIDSLFHLHLAELANNLPLKVFYMTLNNLINKSIYYGEGNTAYGRTTAQQEHERILKALKKRDMDDYRAAIHLHLELIREILRGKE